MVAKTPACFRLILMVRMDALRPSQTGIGSKFLEIGAIIVSFSAVSRGIR